MRIACVLLPSLPLDVFARTIAPADARPFIVSTGGHYPRVVAANAAAREAGIRRDQLISAALALAPDVAVRERDLDAEEAALADVATLCLAFTPSASLALPDAVLAEVERSARIFGGLSNLLSRLAHEVRALGYDATLTLAPTPTAALLLARANGTPQSDAAHLAGALAPLPLTALDLDADALATLRAAGITTFGDACALPRAGLARRFGAHVVDTLDRALGRVPDPREPYRPPPRFTRKLALPAPAADVEALGFAVHRAVDDLAHWLLARGLGVLRLSLALVHERYLRERGVPPTIASFALGSPAREPAHLHAVLRERLARVTLPAPVEAIVLASEETAPLAARNLALLPGHDVEPGTVPLVERLRARLGEDAVGTLLAHDDHRPEQATSETEAVRAPHPDPFPARGERARARGGPTTPSVANGLPEPSAPRPLWLLDEPRPLGQALETKPWVLRDGPERIESGWWDGRDCRRDYFVAESPDGEIVWIYRDHRYGTDDGEWFMHGLFA
jgi:protein ImuB